MNTPLKHIMIGVAIAVAAQLALAPVTGHIHMSIAQRRAEQAIGSFFTGIGGAFEETFDDLEPMVEVPDVTGLERAHAERVLEEHGLELSMGMLSEDRPGARVVSHRPQAGQHVRPGRRVFVNMGPI